MSRIAVSIEVQASPDTLFHCAVDEWERGTMVPRGDPGVPSPATGMGNGFRVRCSGRPLALPADAELEVRDFLEGAGWTAISTSSANVDWSWTFASPSAGPSQVGCRFEYAPVGFGAWIRERTTGRRRRVRTLRKLLESLKVRAEREEALSRVKLRRRAPDTTASGPADGGVG